MADLGAGWGRMGYILKNINPKCSYVILDLPEPLLIASIRMSQLFPKLKFGTYEEVRNIIKISKKLLFTKDIWLMGTQDLAKFDAKSIDVFINIK